LTVDESWLRYVIMWDAELEIGGLAIALAGQDTIKKFL